MNGATHRTRVAVFAVATISTIVFAWSRPTFAQPAVTGFAVVELFTSEGCSSCPPADALLHKISTDADRLGLPIYVLGFHVDYWDHLGWKDRFGSKRNSARQRAYAALLERGKTYTPQMVVNGRRSFVGSDAKRAQKAVEKALSAPPGRDIQVTKVTLDARGKRKSVSVRYQIRVPMSRAVVSVAVVEREIKNDILRGENAGMTVTHANVVRAFGIDELRGQAVSGVKLMLPGDIRVDQSEVIVLLQDSETFAILGATSAPIERTN